MKINITKSLKAPFIFKNEHNWVIIYLIATVFAFIGNFNFNFSFNTGSNNQSLEFIKDALSNPLGITIAIILLIILLVFLVIRFICNCFTCGYIIKTMKLEVENNEIIMPEWKSNMGHFFFTGLKWQIILITYGIMISLLPLMLLLLGLIFADISFNDFTNPEKWTSITFIAFGIAALIILLIQALIYALIVPVIYARFAKENRFLSAFNLVAISGNIIFNITDYIIAILISIALSIGSVVIIIGLCCTCVGILFIPTVIFFILPIIIQNMFAQILKDT